MCFVFAQQHLYGPWLLYASLGIMYPIQVSAGDVEEMHSNINGE